MAADRRAEHVGLDPRAALVVGVEDSSSRRAVPGLDTRAPRRWLSIWRRILTLDLTISQETQSVLPERMRIPVSGTVSSDRFRPQIQERSRSGF